MYDSYEREITYLRISVTERCNLRCAYCMPAEGVSCSPAGDMLSFREITEVAKTLAPLGIRKIRFTGGEPLLRKGIEKLVGMVSRVPGVDETVLTTNGTRLERLAGPLADRGLTRVNISLDTLDPAKYRRITGGGEIGKVLRGIDAAGAAGLTPVRINCVVTPETTEPELEALRSFCRQNGLEIRLIRKMDLLKGKFWKVEGGQGGSCRICNRIRLTAEGHFLPCLFSDQYYSIRQFGIEEAFRRAVRHKPEKGILNSRSAFHRIGG